MTVGNRKESNVDVLKLKTEVLVNYRGRDTDVETQDYRRRTLLRSV